MVRFYKRDDAVCISACGVLLGIGFLVYVRGIF